MTTSKNLLSLGACLIMAAGANTALGQWVSFQNETGARSNVSSSLFANDNQEKDYAFGDVDLDGDIDLVIVRKQPFTSQGKRENVLLMNENGVLVDRTQEFATDSDVNGDNGFKTPTNDRDVQLVDVDGDGWLDIVTATTLTDNQAKHLSHPRVYINKGVNGQGEWQGFVYEDARIPQMHPTAGPRFCSVAVGDVTGDGAPDLYFGDYDSGGGQILDYNNKLLINDGNGFFSDESNARLSFEMRQSAFGAASIILDINGDGVNDVVKQTALNPPQHVAITYNDPGNEGFFSDYETVWPSSAAPYFVAAGDLNNDGLIDLVETDDGADRFKLNTGNGGDGLANFTSDRFYQYVGGGGDNGFGGDAIVADLNNDGFADVVQTDVDVDIAGCNRRARLFENKGFNSGSDFEITLTETVSGGQVAGGISTGMLVGTHDAAIFDLNGDGWLDMVIGRCTGTQIWINQPPIPPVVVDIDFVSAPESAQPGEAIEVIADVSVSEGDGTGVDLIYSVNGGSQVTVPMTEAGFTEGQYSGTIPGGECTDTVQYRVVVTAEGHQGGSFSSPAVNLLVAVDVNVSLEDFEAGSAGWTVAADPSLTSGGWEVAEPNGTNMAPGAASSGDFAFVTENGSPGGSDGAADVDGGPAILTSPAMNVEGRFFEFDVWHVSSSGDTDTLDVEISGDGVNWLPAASTVGTNGWQTMTIDPADFLGDLSSVQLRFVVADEPNDSFTESGVDAFRTVEIVCDPIGGCDGDYNNDGVVDSTDLNEVLGDFGGEYDSTDLNAVLGNFGNGC